MKVVVRCRPMNSKEKERGCDNIITVFEEEGSLKIAQPGDPESTKQFTFDATFGTESKQKAVYDELGAWGPPPAGASGARGGVSATGVFVGPPSRPPCAVPRLLPGGERAAGLQWHNLCVWPDRCVRDSVCMGACTAARRHAPWCQAAARRSR